MKVGIACEGPLDFVVLRELVQELLTPRLNGANLEVQCLQPLVDATSGRYGYGGWGHVMAWCKNHAGGRLSTYLDMPLFAGDTPYDAIIVHIDGDTLEHVSAHTSVPIPRLPVSVTTRLTTMKNILSDWLAAPPTHGTKTCYCIPVMQTEAWMLAALSTQQLAWEEISSKPVYLAELGTKKRKLQNYQTRAQQMRPVLDDLAQAVSSFSDFTQSLRAVVPT